MFEPLSDLASARILVTNDDGVHAPGIALLERIAREFSADVWVVAPDAEQSAVAHSLTVRRPLRVLNQGERRFSVDGTPTDSVFLAVRQILADRPPDLILSGINNGGNLGEDVTYSGTVAAAMEGALLGVRSIALSQRYTPGEPTPWETAGHWAAAVIRRFAAQGWSRDTLLNVNFPARPPAEVTGVETVRQGRRFHADELTRRVDPHGQDYYWIGGQRAEDEGEPGTDLYAIAHGAVSVTPLRVDFTDFDTLARLDTARP